MIKLFAAVIAFSGAVVARAEPVPVVSGLAGLAVPGAIESRSVVFDYGNYDPYDRSNLYGFNHAPSVTHVRDGRLYCAWFSGPYEASIHQVVLGAASDDGGNTWSAAGVLNDEPRLSDFDPAFINAGDRTLLIFSTGRWTRWPFVGFRDAEQKQVGGKSFTIHMKELAGNREEWSSPTGLGAEPGWNCRSNGLRMSTGELLLPIHRLDPLPYVASVLISSDQGRTWRRGPDISTPGKIGAAEPSVTELPDGRLVMSLRVSDGRIWLVRSHDHGRTWSEPERTDLDAAASSSNVYCTNSGRLLLSYNSSAPLRTELSLRESVDGGKSWSRPLVLAEIDAPAEGEEIYTRQVCYPSMCELADGALRIVWAEIEMSPTMQSGVIQSALVRLHGGGE